MSKKAEEEVGSGIGTTVLVIAIAIAFFIIIFFILRKLTGILQ